jgi:Zn-dependent peptidase ImmA (M78 family)
MRLRECWGLAEHPVDSLVQTAEDHQVVVVGWRKQGYGEFDGLAGWVNQHPVTVISTLAAPDRIRFTLAHEIGHLVMDTRAITAKVAEQLAHRFAAAFLVPAERARHELGTRRTRLDWDELGILKRKYGLSMAAWVFRARDLNIITDHHASRLWQELSQRGWRTKEPVEYIGDESPVQLVQMAHRAVAEGLLSPDQIRRAYPEWTAPREINVQPDQLTVYDLLAMPAAERQQVMATALALAAQEAFETFDAFDEMDFNDAAF